MTGLAGLRICAELPACQPLYLLKIPHKSFDRRTLPVSANVWTNLRGNCAYLNENKESWGKGGRVPQTYSAFLGNSVMTHPAFAGTG